MKIIQWIIRSFEANKESLERQINHKTIDLIILSETSFNKDKNYNLKNIIIV